MIEARYRRPDGSWRHVLMRRVVQRDGSGRPIALVGVGIDITERIEQRQRADEMARRFELVTRTAGIGYWMLEENAERAVWSDELCAMFGLPEGAAGAVAGRVAGAATCIRPTAQRRAARLRRLGRRRLRDHGAHFPRPAPRRQRAPRAGAFARRDRQASRRCCSASSST